MRPCFPPFFDPSAEREHTDTTDTEGDVMNGLKILALALIAGGVLSLIYGGFTYTQNTHEAKIGPVEMSLKERKTVNVPVWAGAGAIVAGAALLLMRGSKA